MLGSHDGTYGFTIGQREGCGSARPAPDGKPRFVLDIEPVTGTVTVGPRERLAVDRLTGIRPRWCGTVPERVDGTVQLRAHGDEHRARSTSAGDRVEIELLDPAYGIAPGQAAVIYDGTRVVGSATIAATRRSASDDASPPASGRCPATTRPTPRPCASCSASCPTCPHVPELPGPRRRPPR